MTPRAKRVMFDGALDGGKVVALELWSREHFDADAGVAEAMAVEGELNRVDVDQAHAAGLPMEEDVAVVYVATTMSAS